MNVTYTNPRIVPAMPVTLVTEIAENTLSVPQTMSLTVGEVITQTSTWTADVSISVGLKTTMETGIPLLVDGKVEVSLTATVKYSWGETVTKATNFSKIANATLPPNTKARLTLSGTQYTTNIGYSATAIYTYFDDETTSVPITGHFSGVQIKDTTTKWEPLT